MRLMLVLGMLFSWLAAPVAEAAVVVTGNSVAATLANRLVLVPSVPPLAPPLVGGNVTIAVPPVAAAPVATTLTNQSGLVTTVNFGLVNGVALTMPNQGIMLTNGNIFGTGGVLFPTTVGDASVEVALGAFTGTTHDAASLTFNFTTPAGLNFISLSVIFASNEVIGSTTIKDAAVIIVDGVNQGKFPNGDPLSNLNTNSISPVAGIITGFTKVSSLQTIIAPLNTALAVHTIKIAIADHADSSRDSAILLSAMKAIAAPPQAGGGAAATTGVTVVQGNAPGVAPAAGSVDPIPPRLRLIGSAQVDLMLGNAYTDPGAIAFDNIDGNLTGRITTTNPVLINTVGTYFVSYNVSDLTGNAASTLTRKVIVHAPTAADVLPPVVTSPADVMLTTSDSRGVLITDPRLAGFFASVIAVDNLAVVGPISNDAPLPPLFIPVGKTTVIFSAKDAALNTGTAKATITVIGTTRTKPGIDLDLDGIPDSWEIAVFASLLTATAISDADLDGLTDLLEWQLGTNPLLPHSNPLSVSTDSWSVIYSNNPSDSDNDGVIDALENASSVLNPAIVTGLHVGINSAVTYSINAGAGNQLKSVHTNVPGAGAPLNIVSGFGVLSFRIKTAAVGGTATVRVTSSTSFGSGAQFYKVNHAGVYSLIPLTSVSIVAANIVDLTLKDGGPFDLGGPVADGWIIDPIAIGSAPQILGGSGPSGGCSIVQSGNVDPLLPALVLLALLYLIRSRKTSIRA